MANRILCAVSILARASFEPISYSYGTEVYHGVQTNQAPVKMLLDQAYRANSAQPVTDVLCLCTPESLQPKAFTVGQTAYEISPYEYFRTDVADFCAEHGIPVPTFTALHFAAGHTADAVEELVQKLQPHDVLHIDVTGGGRDLTALMTLAAQVMRFMKVDFGRVAYGNIMTRSGGVQAHIEVQEETYGLVDLLNAISEFSNYGKASGLCRCFESTACLPLRELCRKMKEFADSLALCRSANADQTIREIHDLMDQLQNLPAEQLAGTDERLFRALIPTLQESFVQLPFSSGNEKEEAARLKLNLIRWCTENELLQQALSFYRENAPQCLVDLQVIVPTEAVLQLLEEIRRNKKNNKIAEYQSLADVALELIRRNEHPLQMAAEAARKFGTPASELQIRRQVTFIGFDKWEKRNKNTIQEGVNSLRQDEYYCYVPRAVLEQLMVDLDYMLDLRNQVMHASNEYRPNPQRDHYLQLHGLKPNPYALSLEELRSAMLLAVGHIENACAVRTASPL